jgi:hypothetical protein
VGNDETENLLAEIGHLLAEDGDYPVDGTLLYARVDRSMVAPSIFKDRGNHVLYRAPDLDQLGDALLDLWEAQTVKPFWSEIEYVIRGNTFTAAYVYPDEIDPEEDPLDRRDRVVARHFGDKPIVYPAWNNDDDTPQYTL